MAWGYSDSQYKVWKKNRKVKKNRRKEYYDNKRQLDLVRHLEKFHSRVKTGHKIISLLQEYSLIIVPNYILYQERRKQFKATNYPKARCFACGKPSVHNHHIILLKHGGSNHRKNVVKLCIECHKIIHPYLVLD